MGCCLGPRRGIGRIGHAMRRGAEVIGEPECKSHDGEGAVRVPAGWEHAAACDVKIFDSEHAGNSHPRHRSAAMFPFGLRPYGDTCRGGTPANTVDRH